MAILTLKDGSEIVPAVVDAIVKGYKEDLILEELAQAIEAKRIDQPSFEAAVDALRLFASRLSASVNMVANSMEQFEFHEPQDSIIKSKPMSLAQQVMRDVNGFRSALDDQEGEPNSENDGIDWPESR